MGEVEEHSILAFGPDGLEEVDYYEHTSGALNESTEITVHQAYVQLDDLFVRGSSLRAGRFEFAIANERLYGPAKWDLVGRSFDGAVLSTKFWRSHLDVIMLKIRDNRTDYGETIYGLRAVIPRWRLEPFIMYENDRNRNYYNDFMEQIGFTEDGDYLQRVSTGAYYRDSLDAFDWEAQWIYQFGRQTGWVHIDATLLDAEVGFSPLNDSLFRTYVGVDWTTGRTMNTHSSIVRSFAAPFASCETFRGDLHLFTAEQVYGLSDVYVGAAFRITDRAKGQAAAHHFETSNPRYVRIYYTSDFWPDSSKVSGPSTKVGNELDLELSWFHSPHARLDLIATIFFPTMYYAYLYDPSPIYRLYTTLTVDF